MRTLVRLGFHDCVSASGTCDGCIDLDDPENNGLADVLNTLTPICNTHAIGLADCWAAAASIAAEELSDGGADVPMFFGRADAASCGPFDDGPEALFPSGEDGMCSRTNAYSLLCWCCELCSHRNCSVRCETPMCLARSPREDTSSSSLQGGVCMQDSTARSLSWNRRSGSLRGRLSPSWAPILWARLRVHPPDARNPPALSSVFRRP